MKHQFYIIREDVLPYVVKRVLQVKSSLKADQSLTIQEAVDMHDCSRSAFYKYKTSFHQLALDKFLKISLMQMYYRASI
ncbi:hypothetical protein QS430_09540 [Staphylococcus pseudintermedius]|nr:hypothetical protein QS430_09540 [Staphylococcus pseudintermedius]